MLAGRCPYWVGALISLPMHLYLVRHPLPTIAPGICYGSTDIAADPEMQAQLLSRLLTTLPKNIPLFASPLRRCADLAVSLRDALGNASMTLDERLVEMHFGSWEMRSWDDIPRSEIDSWDQDTVGYRPGGGESVLQMAQRVKAFYDDCIGLKKDGAVICHAGTIRLLLAAHRGLNLIEMAQYAAQNPIKIAYGEMIILDC